MELAEDACRGRELAEGCCGNSLVGDSSWDESLEEAPGGRSWRNVEMTICRWLEEDGVGRTLRGRTLVEGRSEDGRRSLTVGEGRCRQDGSSRVWPQIGSRHRMMTMPMTNYKK